MFGDTKEEHDVEQKAQMLIQRFAFKAPRDLKERMRQQRVLLVELERETEGAVDPIDRLRAMARVYGRNFPNN